LSRRRCEAWPNDRPYSALAIASMLGKTQPSAIRA
jgi:hypothetical protein